MSQAASIEPANIISILSHSIKDPHLGHLLHKWEDVVFSSLIVVFLSVIGFVFSRRLSLIPSSKQNGAEVFVDTMAQFLLSILGDKGKRFIPFLGTLFIYILIMNIMGLIPLLKSPTANLATTTALSLTVFVYFLFTAIKEQGVIGFMDHLAGKPRGAIALSIILPLFLFSLELISVFIRPITLSLRLRGNIWGEDLLLAIISSFGLWGLPVLFFLTLLALIASTVQALVFFLLSTIYFALVIEDHH